MKSILKSLHASSYREATTLLDDIARKSWKKIQAPIAPIAKLRLLVLWIARSPQRIQKWDNRPGCTKAINYDIDTRWNSTFLMIRDAIDCRRQLEDTVNDEQEIESLRLSPDDWKQLFDIKKILQPFNEYTEYVSRNNPSIHMAVRLFEELSIML
jgi:hypothetical protein